MCMHKWRSKILRRHKRLFSFLKLKKIIIASKRQNCSASAEIKVLEFASNNNLRIIMIVYLFMKYMNIKYFLLQQHCFKIHFNKCSYINVHLYKMLNF